MHGFVGEALQDYHYNFLQDCLIYAHSMKHVLHMAYIHPIQYFNSKLLAASFHFPLLISPHF